METSSYISLFRPPRWNTQRQRWNWDSHVIDCKKISWEDIVEFLYDCSIEPIKNKHDAFLFSPVRFKYNYRLIANFINCGAVVIDIDNGLTIQAARQLLTDIRIESLLYTTASHSPDKEKFRVVIPLLNFVGADEYPLFWRIINLLFGNSVDPQTKDLTRMFFVPGKYVGVQNEFHHFEGGILSSKDWIDAGKDLIASDDERKAQLKAQKINIRRTCHRGENTSNPVNLVKRRMTRKHFSWRGLFDCPFVKQHYIDEYRALSEGWYHGLYIFMCKVAGNAEARGYPIDVSELAELAEALDQFDGRWYARRPLAREAQNAIDYVNR